MIQGICGRTYIGSSVPPAQQDSEFLCLWESKLRSRLATIGSTESALIWREKASPLGQLTSRLAPSTLHSNGTDSGGLRSEAVWPAPKSSAAGPDFAKLERSDTGPSLQTVMAGTVYWPAVKASAAGETSRSGDRKDEPLMGSLIRKAQWSTPRASDGEKGAPKQEFSGGGEPLPAQIYANADRIFWATPTVHGNNNRAGISEKAGDGLGTQLRGAETSMWVAPSARDYKDSEGMATEGEQVDGDQIAIPGLEKHRQRIDQLPRQMVATGRIGAGGNGSSVTTEKRGAPNPVFACSLMGWPEELIFGALRAIQSFRSLPRKSSGRSSTRKRK